MQYKALAIDLDGTLLVGEEIPEANIDAVRRARDAGLQIIIATARWRHMAERVARQLEIEGVVIACSGAQVYDPRTGVDVFDHRLPLDFATALFDICNAQRCIATVTFGDQVSLKLDGEPDMSQMGEEMSWVKRLSADAADLPRIAAIQGTACVAQIREELQAPFGETVNIFDSIGPTGRIIITVTAKAGTKGNALAAACEHLDLNPANVVAFGDAENDLEMFRIAGASVAMGQAEVETRERATFVSRPNTEAGVAHAIDHLLANGGF
jgi:Cof subfamily protein (haloacid dehalogenase superfamily)